MRKLSSRRMIAIFTILSGFLALNGITSEPMVGVVDGITKFGFPLTFIEYGGFVWRNKFDFQALFLDVGLALAVTGIFLPVIEYRLRPSVNIRPQFRLAALLFTIGAIAILLGFDQLLASSGWHHVPAHLAQGSPIISVGFAYFGSRLLGKESLLGNFLILMGAFTLVTFLTTRLSLANICLLLFEYWSMQLWVIWFFWMVDVDQFFPDIPDKQELETKDDLE